MILKELLKKDLKQPYRCIYIDKQILASRTSEELLTVFKEEALNKIEVADVVYNDCEPFHIDGITVKDLYLRIDSSLLS